MSAKDVSRGQRLALRFVLSFSVFKDPESFRVSLCTSDVCDLKCTSYTVGQLGWLSALRALNLTDFVRFTIIIEDQVGWVLGIAPSRRLPVRCGHISIVLIELATSPSCTGRWRRLSPQNIGHSHCVLTLDRRVDPLARLAPFNIISP